MHFTNPVLEKCSRIDALVLSSKTCPGCAAVTRQSFLLELSYEDTKTIRQKLNEQLISHLLNT